MSKTQIHLTIVLALTFALFALRSDVLGVVAFLAGCVLYGLNTALEAREGDRLKALEQKLGTRLAQLEQKLESRLLHLSEKVDRYVLGGKR